MNNSHGGAPMGVNELCQTRVSLTIAHNRHSWIWVKGRLALAQPIAPVCLKSA
jgi:hypothetical protein